MRWRTVFLFWAALMAVIFIVGLLVFGFHDVEPPALFGGTVAVMLVLTVLVAWRRWDRRDDARLRAHPDLSPPIPWLGVSCGLLAYSLEVGWWLSLIAGGMVVAGIAALARELVAERRFLHAATAAHPRGDPGPGAVAAEARGGTEAP
jgi:uncharacterized membrane protein YfcA